jgi:hypothetical protein
MVRPLSSEQKHKAGCFEGRGATFSVTTQIQSYQTSEFNDFEHIVVVIMDVLKQTIVAKGC